MREVAVEPVRPSLPRQVFGDARRVGDPVVGEVIARRTTWPSSAFGTSTPSLSTAVPTPVPIVTIDHHTAHGRAPRRSAPRRSPPRRRRSTRRTDDRSRARTPSTRARRSTIVSMCAAVRRTPSVTTPGQRAADRARAGQLGARARRPRPPPRPGVAGCGVSTRMRPVACPVVRSTTRRLDAAAADVDTHERCSRRSASSSAMNLVPHGLVSGQWRFSRTTHSWATAARPRWCRARARSTGGARRASTRPPASRRCSARPTHGRFCIAPAPRADGRTSHHPPLPPGNDGARDRARRPSTGASASSTASRSGTPGRSSCASSKASTGTVDMTRRAHRAVRLRLDRPVGAPGRRALARDRRARRPRAVHAGAPRTATARPRRREFTVAAGEQVPFVLGWFPSQRPAPGPRRRGRRSIDAHDRRTGERWSARCALLGRVARAGAAFAAHARGADVRADRRHRRRARPPRCRRRSAASRNWDYRYCWVRDATLTLEALPDRRLPARGVALARVAVARRGRRSRHAADDVRRRRRTPAHRARARLAARATRDRRPVRTGNGAHSQLQLDVYGELLDVLWQAARAGTPPSDELVVARAPAARRARGPLARARRRHLGGARRSPPLHALEGACAGSRSTARSRWSSRPATTARSIAGARSATRSTPRCCEQGYNEERGAFTQSFGTDDARRVGAHDPARRLPARRRPARRLDDRRDQPRAAPSTGSCCATTRPTPSVDGIGEPEGVFLPCSFWMVEALALAGRPRRGARVVRAPARGRQRPRPLLRGVRRRRRAACSATSRRRSRTSRSSPPRTRSRPTGRRTGRRRRDVATPRPSVTGPRKALT